MHFSPQSQSPFQMSISHLAAPPGSQQIGSILLPTTPAVMPDSRTAQKQSRLRPFTRAGCFPGRSRSVGNIVLVGIIFDNRATFDTTTDNVMEGTKRSYAGLTRHKSEHAIIIE